MKETRLINRFSEKIFIWGNGPFWAQKLCIITLDLPEEFFENLPNEEGINGINGINNFPEKKNCLGQMDHFRPKNGASS